MRSYNQSKRVQNSNMYNSDLTKITQFLRCLFSSLHLLRKVNTQCLSCINQYNVSVAAFSTRRVGGRASCFFFCRNELVLLIKQPRRTNSLVRSRTNRPFLVLLEPICLFRQEARQPCLPSARNVRMAPIPQANKKYRLIFCHVGIDVSLIVERISQRGKTQKKTERACFF